MYKNVLFYSFTPIPDPIGFRDDQRIFTKELGLKGKILVSEEGINGNVSGPAEATEKYVAFLQETFPGIDCKIGQTQEHNFSKMIVRYRKEIVTFGVPVSLENKAPYIEPEELKALLDSGEKLVLLDARNEYEASLGTFSGAIVPDTLRFKEFPRFVDEQLSVDKDAPIVTFCTGGIRCEKASAYLREKGFTNVRQLHGGIIRYGEVVGADHWEGKCFVYDERLALDMSAISEVHNNQENTCSVNPVYFKKHVS